MFVKKEKRNGAKEALDAYNEGKERRKKEIKEETSRWKRFWKWCWYLTTWPFRWAWMSIHDWKFLIIFIIVFLIVSSAVWGFYLAGLILWANESARNWCFGIGSFMWLWWIGPFTPFTQLVIIISIGVKAIVDRIGMRIKKRI